MGENKKNKGFFYITRDSLIIYQDDLSAPLVFPFEKNIISDFEIINKEEFTKQFAVFVQQNKVTPAGMSIILAEDTFFEKDIPLLEKGKKDEALRLFIDTVPFEHVATNSFQTKTGGKLIVTNKDFFDSIIEIASKLGFVIQYVIPAYYFDKKITSIDAISGKYILEKIPQIILNFNSKGICISINYSINASKSIIAILTLKSIPTIYSLSNLCNDFV